MESGSMRIVIHREPIESLATASWKTPDPITGAAPNVASAWERGRSWVQRNAREWPYGCALVGRIEGEEMLFSWEHDDGPSGLHPILDGM